MPDVIAHGLTEADHRIGPSHVPPVEPRSASALRVERASAMGTRSWDAFRDYISTSVEAPMEPLKAVLEFRGLASEARGIFQFGLLESLASTYDQDSYLLRSHGSWY